MWWCTAGYTISLCKHWRDSTSRILHTRRVGRLLLVAFIFSWVVVFVVVIVIIGYFTLMEWHRPQPNICFSLTFCCISFYGYKNTHRKHLRARSPQRHAQGWNKCIYTILSVHFCNGRFAMQKYENNIYMRGRLCYHQC